MRIALFLAAAGLCAGQSTSVDAGPPYKNELPGLKFYNVGRWRTLAPLVSTMDDVRMVLGKPDQESDVSQFTKPYPGDKEAKKPVYIYYFGDDWELLVYPVRYCFHDSGGSIPDDRLCSLDLVPRRPLSFRSVKFPPVFKKSHVGAADAEWDKYSDGAGLVYAVYTTPGPYGGHRAGDLKRVSYGPPGRTVDDRLSTTGGCYSDCAHLEPACQRAWQPHTAAIFLGTAVEVHKDTAAFRVDEAFRGVSGESATVSTGANCSYPFSKGMQYLVYANRQTDGGLHVDLCGGTEWASEAAAELAYLRRLPPASQGGTISGVVFRYAGPKPTSDKALRSAKPAASQTVQIKGSRLYTVKTDARGRFFVAGVRPGGYEIKIETAERVIPNPSQFVQVFGAGCAEVEFWLDPF